MVFAPLHVKSEHSPGYGSARVEELLRRAAEQGFPALALTDIENLYGHVKLHYAAAAFGVRAITGVELRRGYEPHGVGSRTGRLVLLARDRAGYESLCRIITRRLTGRGRARTTPDPLDCLRDEPRGVFYLSDDAPVIEALLRDGVAATDVRFLLVRPAPPLGVASRPPRGVRVLADTDVVMADPADQPLHAMRLAIRRGVRIDEIGDAEAPARSLPAADDVHRLFGDVPDALAETAAVAEACTLDLTRTKTALPSLALPPGESAEYRLEQRCRERLAATAAAYDARLTKELGVLRELGLAAYFLIVATITDEARRRGIRVAGRGSAAGSLAAHLLDITPIDPLAHGLSFERFVHSGKTQLPDIDLDLPSDRRDELIDWVFRRFGDDRVAMVSAHQTFRRRAAYREGLKALGLQQAAVDLFGRQIRDDDPQAPLPLELLPERYRASAPLIERLIGQLQHISVHPGGIVIADPRIDAHVPLERAPKGVVVTQYDMHALERLRLVKIDLLGNRALTAIEETVARAGGALRPLPADEDAATRATLARADTVGCFQIETPVMRSVLRRVPVGGIADLMNVLAIVRPGPGAGEAKSAYIRRARGESAPTPPHPALAAALAGTRGMLLYEEDVMATLATLTGWSAAAADELRARLIAAGDEPAAIDELGTAFTAAATRNGVAPGEAARVWRLLARFASYAFNKAHAASYARLAWETAYLKTHAPLAFACAVLNSYGGAYPLRSVAADFARHGIRLVPPSVNRSDVPCSLEGDAVRIGLGAVKRLTHRTRAVLLRDRPFHDMRELVGRVAPRVGELEALVLSGACDGVRPLTAASYPFTHERLLRQARDGQEFLAIEGSTVAAPPGSRMETYRSLVRVRNELAFLEMYLTAHPMGILRAEAQRAGCVPAAELERHIGAELRVAGVVAAARRAPAGGGAGMMQFVTLEDETGFVEAVVLPPVYRTLGDPVSEPGPFLVSGRMTDGDDPRLVVSDVRPFHLRERPYGRTASNEYAR